MCRVKPLFCLLFVLLWLGLPSLGHAQPVPAPAAPAAPIPVKPGAVEAPNPVALLRAGDILFLGLPGEDSLNKTFQVDRRGNLQLPEIGLIQVAGMTVAQAQDAVRQELARVFRDVGRFELTLKERRLLVTVSGVAKTPGPVELPGDATIQMALNAAGGAAPGAQLDRLQVRRGTEIITFDYKKYLDTGDSKLLPVLQPLDEIFLPASPLLGNVQLDVDSRTLQATGDGGDDRSSVKVFGEVNAPGSFAYKKEASIIEYIMRAGGVTRYSSDDSIRVITDGKPVMFNLKEYLDNGSKSLLPALAPGTMIYVPKEVEEVKGGGHTIYVMGEVFKPGAFEVKPGTSFLDILANAGGPTRFADTAAIRILHADGGVDSFSLLAYTESAKGAIAMPKLHAGDALFVPQKSDDDTKGNWLKNKPDQIVRIFGAIATPGRYEWSDEMSILDLIAQAGGPSQRANTARIEILPNDKGGEAKVVIFDLAKLVDQGGRLDQLPEIRPGYTINIPELPTSPNDSKGIWLQQPAESSIYILGALKTPGRYAFNSNLHFIDILSAADGPTATADLENIRVTHRHGGAGPTTVSKVDLGAYFNTGDERLLPRVEPGDVIYIPDRSSVWLTQSKESTVRVLGAVGKPGRYRFDDTMTILDLLAEAGGPVTDSYQEKIIVVNYAQVAGKDQARVFNLIEFAKTGDFRLLPVLRAGDTVYVPSSSQSNWRIFIDGVKDIVEILSVFALIGKV